jgi:hypothetical protein
MTLAPRHLACALALGITVSMSCHADSVASSASSAGSASLGSLSDSVQGSSNSSKKAVAEGDYRVIEVADVPERPDLLRLTMQPANGQDEDAVVYLRVPREALEQRALVPGDIVTATTRPYGVAFARGDTHEAFFLALADGWRREIDPRPIAF